MKKNGNGKGHCFSADGRRKRGVFLLRCPECLDIFGCISSNWSLYCACCVERKHCTLSTCGLPYSYRFCGLCVAKAEILWPFGKVVAADEALPIFLGFREASIAENRLT